jgi:chitosanase
MLTPLQKAAAQAIVNVFETGSPRGDYARVTLLPGDSGRLTYGRSQTTLARAGSHRLIAEYCAADGATHADALRPYLAPLEAKSPELDTDETFKALLREAGADPVMRRVQDDFFDRVYWLPAVRAAQRIGVTEPLGVAVVYDSHVHGSWAHVRRLTDEAHGDVTPPAANARGSPPTYRRAASWLASRRAPILRATVYRMDEFARLIAEGCWALTPPFTVRNRSISRNCLT